MLQQPPPPKGKAQVDVSHQYMVIVAGRNWSVSLFLYGWASVLLADDDFVIELRRAYRQEPVWVHSHLVSGKVSTNVH